MSEQKYNTCRFVQSVGNIAVFVTPNCPNVTMVHGCMVSTKSRCNKCKHWEGRESDEQNEV